jgi:integrase
MARPRGIPTLTRHKASGLAVVRLDGRDHYLGRFGSRAAEAAYHRLVAEHLAAPARPAGEGALLETVAELADAYLAHARRYYRKDGRPTSEVAAIEAAWRYVLRLYAECRLEDFGPLALRAVREAMVAANLARRTINNQIHRLRRGWRWAAENELLDPILWQRLQAVAGLKAGRGGRETAPRQAVPWESVAAVRPHIAAQVWAMVELQWLTGMRPGEAVRIRGDRLDVSGTVWIYDLPDHKTVHQGRTRRIAIGPRAQQVLAPWLNGRPGWLFSPAEAEIERKAHLAAERAAHGGPGSHKRGARRPRRRPGERYSAESYRRAIRRACAKAGVSPWTPHQLRHAFATRAEAHVGLEAAQAALGHAQPQVTALYVHRDAARAAEAALQIG